MKKLLFGAALLGLCFGAFAEDTVVGSTAPAVVKEAAAPVATQAAEVKAPVVKVSKKASKKAVKKAKVASLSVQ